MYSHCLFCHESLGSNEAIEEFPVGKRLAFDAEKGRLWAVCPKCARWNLSPLEVRWEAIERAEKLYRETRMRVHTDNIGLTRLRDGTELVRIGRALRPEIAAWRYGEIFSRRLRRTLLAIGGGGAVIAGGSLASGAPAVVAAATAAAPVLGIVGYLSLMITVGNLGRWRATKVVGNEGKVLKVYRADLEHTQLLGAEGDDPWRTLLKHSYGREELSGERARRVLGALMTNVNRRGALSRTVSRATEILSVAGDSSRLAAQVAAESRRRMADFPERWRHAQRNPNELRPIRRGEWKSNQPSNPGALPALPREQRLAFEMALHEETERRAMEGELALLEAAWREAEEIAAISDSLLVPKSAEQFIERQRSKTEPRI